MDKQKRIKELKIEIEVLQKVIDKKEENDPCDTWVAFSAYMKPEWDKLSMLDAEHRQLIEPEYSELPKYGDVMSLKDFIENVKCGGFIDYDGSGNYVKDGKMSNIDVYPSDVSKGRLRKEFDTIIWFNK